jgi:hypothetical protein
MTTSVSPRRFKVEPVETIARSSKDRSQDKTSQRPRRFVPEPIETSTKTNRRFAPDPIEITVKSSKNPDQSDIEGFKRPRRFVPELIDTTNHSNRQFAPEPTETRKRSSRKKFAEEWDSETANAQKKERSPREPRKFMPRLVETARRSRRAGASSPTLKATDKTEATPVNSKCLQASNLTVPSPPTNTPTFDYSQNPLFAEIQRATSPLARHRPIKRQSHHCFRVPDLDAIESSESEEGSVPSSPLRRFVSCPTQSYKEPTRVRESVDEGSGYLLELAAKAAEKQLREEAMAAFPNNDHHEPVDHFVDREDSFVDETRSRPAPSHHAVNWDVIAMQQHRDKVEQQEYFEQKMKDAQEAITKTHNPNVDTRNNAAAFIKSCNMKDIEGCQKDNQLDCMRKEARPPMLGKDIKFPRCNSPEPARFDTTQGCDVVKKAMCYLSEQSEHAEKRGSSLWCGKGNGKRTSQVLSLWGDSNPSSRSQSRQSQSGLWGGCCVTSGLEVSNCPSGLLTPRKEKEDPLSPHPTPSTTLLPPTPPASHADFACIDEKLATEVTIEEEFGDDFVTQVYNYLSLGYPSMAQPFDAELSKISGISVAELGQDDHLAETRGYIRLGADGNLTKEEITEESCMRWRALRIYIREWAKQEPGMAGEITAGGTGTAVRRGSWGI